MSAALFFAAQVQSQTIVTNVSDIVDGDISSPEALLQRPGSDGISLREALAAAQNASGSHAIAVDASLKGGTIHLVSSLPRIARDDLTLIGLPDDLGMPAITLDGTIARDVDPALLRERGRPGDQPPASADSDGRRETGRHGCRSRGSHLRQTGAAFLAREPV